MTPTPACSMTATRRCEGLSAVAPVPVANAICCCSTSAWLHAETVASGLSAESHWLPLQLWLAWDASANQYVAAEGQVGTSAEAALPDCASAAAGSSMRMDGGPVADGAAAAALPGMDAYVPLPASAAADAAGGPVAVAAAAEGTETKKPPVRRRGATIGSAPQLSREGIQAALRQAEVIQTSIVLTSKNTSLNSTTCPARRRSSARRATRRRCTRPRCGLEDPRFLAPQVWTPLGNANEPHAHWH